jgi:hypothetical protein
VKIIIRLDVEQCDIPVRGNALAMEDEAQNKACEDEIIRRRDNGDVFAWFNAIVEARAEVQGEVFIGRDTLGACSYKDLADFKRPGGYYEDMKQEAINQVKQSMIAAEKRASAAAKGLMEFDHNKVVVEEES